MRIRSNPCTFPGCTWPIFANKLCKSHQPYKPKAYKKPKAVRRYSPKRVVKNRDYAQACKESDAKYSHDGETYCFFCLKPMREETGHHHAAGRTGENLLKGVIPAHTKCHLAPQGFHGLTPAQLAKKPYIDRYLALLKETDELKYNKLKRRIDESNPTE